MTFKFNPLTGQLDLVNSSIPTLLVEEIIIKKIAGDTISPFKCVYLDTNSSCKLSDNSTEALGTVIGITSQSGNIGDEISIVTEGIINDPFFNFNLNEPIFLGSNGSIINYQPTSGVLTQVGYGLGIGSIRVKIETLKIL
jgi:hypothetical protein